MAVEFKCPIHPRYKAIKLPTADCPYCDMLWHFIEEFRFEVNAFKEEKTSKKLAKRHAKT